MAALLLPCLALAALVYIFYRADPQKLATADAWMVLPLYFSVAMSLWSAVHTHGMLRDGLPFQTPASVLWVGYGTATVIGVAAASAFWAGPLHRASGGLVGMIAGVLLHFAALLLWPLWCRLRLRRVFGIKVALAADRTIRDVIEPRIEAAGREFAGSRRGFLERADHYGLRRDRPPTAGAIEAAGRSFGYAMWHFIGPVLGPASRDYGRYCLIDAVDRASEPGELPGLLRAAAQVDALVDAASFFAKPQWCCRRMRRSRACGRAAHRDRGGRAGRPIGKSCRSPEPVRSCGSNSTSPGRTPGRSNSWPSKSCTLRIGPGDSKQSAPWARRG
jgi:hypothetical protein